MTKPLINLKYLQSRLHHWALWYKTESGYALGFSSCSLEYRFLQHGVMIKSHGYNALPCNSEAEEMEAYVCELAKEAPDIALALRRRYFQSGFETENNKKHYVDRAHQWLLWKINHFNEDE